VSKQILVIGAGRFGSAVALTLVDVGHEVVVADVNEATLQPLMDEVAHAAVVDATDEEALRQLGAGEFDTIVIGIGTNFEASILATVAAKAAGGQRVVAKATSAIAARVLLRVGADEVVRPEHDMGVRLAHQIATPSLVDAFRLGDDYEVVEIEVGDEEMLHGSLADLRLPNEYGVQVMAVTRESGLKVSPGAQFQVQRGDRLVVIGEVDAVRKFEAALGR
jgi:trk system potassium uptake protein TrkA